MTDKKPSIKPRATRAAARRRTLLRVITDVLDLDESDDLISSLDEHQCRSIDDIIVLRDSDIDTLATTNKDGTSQCVPLFKRNLIKVLKSWNYHLLISEEIKRVDWDNPTYVNQESFDEYRVSLYDPDNPARAMSRSVTKSPPGSIISTTNNASNLGNKSSPAQDFRRGIKRDKTHYTVLKDEKQWTTWKNQTESTAFTHGCENILDSEYLPSTVNDVELFDEQQKFMYDVFLMILQTDRGKHYTRVHKTRKDAQSVWRDYVAYMSTSTKADLEIEGLVQKITSN